MSPPLNAFERLFLLEFFVDYIYLLDSAIDNEESKLCISFQFLHYPAMRVCEEDFHPNADHYEEEQEIKIIFKSGKSCLFSVTPDSENQISSDFDLVIAVCQQTKNIDPPRTSPIGRAVVSLGPSFVDLIQSPDESEKHTSNIKHELFPLQSKSGYFVGNLAAFVRLSTFGKILVTQFQLGGEENTNYMFKGTDPKKLFKDDEYKMKPPIIKKKSLRKSDDIKPQEVNPAKQRTPPITSTPRSKDQIQSQSETDETDDTTEYESETESETIESTCIKSVEEKEDGETTKEAEEYNVIDAEINGHAISIRFVKKCKAPKDEPKMPLQQCCCPPEPPICPYAPKLNLCDCDFPLPPEIIPRCPPQYCQPPPCCCCVPPSSEYVKPESNPVIHSTDLQSNSLIEKEKVIGDCQTDEYQQLEETHPEEPEDPLELEPGCVAMKGDQVFFQMANRPATDINEREKKHCSSVYYTVGATVDGEEMVKNVVQITPQSFTESFVEETTKPSGPVSGLPVQNKQENMFLFKINRQNDKVSTTCKLEMELRTPKEKEIKPEAIAIETQYLVTDFPPVEKKKKGKEKGKKKGKGKGKKKPKGKVKKGKK